MEVEAAVEAKLHQVDMPEKQFVFFFRMGNAASVSGAVVCAAKDADYAAIVAVLRACFPDDVAEAILDHFDWSYDTRFVCTTRESLGTETRITTTHIDTYRDATFSYWYKHVSRDEFDGDTSVSETHLKGRYRIWHRRLILTGETTSTYTNYKNTFDTDGSMHTVRNPDVSMTFCRTDFCQYSKVRLSTA